MIFGPASGTKLLKLKLLKEIRQRQPASQSGRVIGGKATALDLHAHRFAASHNSPTPRRRIGGLAVWRSGGSP